MNKELNKRRREYLGKIWEIERKCKYISQEDFAKKIGYTQEEISRIECGKKKMDVIEMMTFCEAFNLTLTDLAEKMESMFFAYKLIPYSLTNTRNKRLGKVKVEISWNGNNFSASLPNDFPESVEFTADTFVELQKKIKNKIDYYSDEMRKSDISMPIWFRYKEYELEYKFLDTVSVLKAYSPYISLAAISRATGINQNQLAHYASGLKKARPQQLERIVTGINKIGKELMTAVF